MINKKNTIILTITVLVYAFFIKGIDFIPAENLGITSGIGVDILKKISENDQYQISISTYNFNDKKENSSRVDVGVGRTIVETRQDRQRYLDNRFLLGLERVQIFSEEAARFGIKGNINSLFKNPNVNDISYNAICSGKAEDILKYKIPSYPSSSDYIEGMLQRSNQYNFFSDNYKLMDVYVRLEGEGRSVVLPFIEIKDNKLQITGTALFNEDKMIKKLDMEETRIMNLLRENNVKGILSLENSSKDFINFFGVSKRKVKCEKSEEKYIFYIYLNIKGAIVNNLMYENIFTDPYEKKQFEEKMSKKVEKMSDEFIKNIKNQYKVDCLELGSEAAAKYGRDKNIDWNKEIQKSDIKIKVDINVTSQGRGDY